MTQNCIEMSCARPAAHPRSSVWIAALVAIALAFAPIPTLPFVSTAAAQAVPKETDTETPGLRKYGSVPPPSPSIPDPVDAAKSSAGVGIGAAAVPLSPGQKLPDLGDSSQTVMSPAQERKLGEAIMRQVRASGAYLDDAEVNDYLNELGNRLVAATRDARQDFLFFAVPDGQINAFALPGGFIGINTGLILLAQDESQLASVLAHEISHVTQHHVTRGMANQMNVLLTSIAGIALAVLASKAGGNSSGQATAAAIAGSQALGMQQQINFTRENEFEADRIGFQRLVAAGFDPTAMAALFDRLQRSSRFVEGNTPSYLRSHPITYERVAEAKSRAQNLPYRQVPDSLDFHMVRALLQSYQGEAKEQVVRFDNSIAERKFNNEIAEHYGLVASLLRARNIPRARVELATLEKIAPPHPMIEAMAGNVLMAAQEYPAAVARFEAALERYPNKMQLVHDYPDALIKAGRAADAAAFLERELVRFPGEGSLHETAARAYAAQDKRLKQHQHQGEYYAWIGNLPLAIEQFRLALKSGDGDFYQMSVVETRLRALQQEFSEQQKLG
jgi:predicted Zn-dependent protease